MSAFFFVILGTRPVVRQEEPVIRRHCPRCGDWRNFRMMSIQSYFTLFFVPLFPLGAPRKGYACVSCGLPVDCRTAESGVQSREAEHESDEKKNAAAADTLVVQCPRCDGRMKVPLRPAGFNAICPHCAKEFRVKGEREPVPEAQTRE